MIGFIAFTVLIALVAVERVVELIVSRRNLRWSGARGGCRLPAPRAEPPEAGRRAQWRGGVVGRNACGGFASALSRSPATLATVR